MRRMDLNMFLDHSTNTISRQKLTSSGKDKQDLYIVKENMHWNKS